MQPVAATSVAPAFKAMISIIDYGVGNIRAFLNVFRRLNIAARTVTTAHELAQSGKVILPGVGHFDNAMERLNASGMREPLDELVLQKNTPVLGVCVGMQMLAGWSDEGRLPGLGYIQGRVKAFDSTASVGLQLPHMGWNDVRAAEGHRLFTELENEARFYFLHSFYFVCDRPQDVAGVSSYGSDFSSAVNRDNIYGVQFHPEKSHHFGARLLKNFSKL